YDAEGNLQHVGITSSFKMDYREKLVTELEPLREGALDAHPWASWAGAEEHQRKPGMGSRWSVGKDLSWEPLRVERVIEVAYDGLQGRRFRHAASFVRWRPDREPASCTYAQLEITPPFELQKIFRASGS
ncbi:MAG: ATP-dependent DNA ligase, partial [Deltaproteobacteria bacterium]